MVDAAVTCLKSRFHSPAFNFVRDVEATVIRAISSNVSLNLDVNFKHFGDDLNESRLKLHLSMLRDMCHASAIIATCMNDVVHLFQKKPELGLLFPELFKLIQLFLTITSCTVERSFSSLRRLKTYLRSVTTQKCFNHVAILHCHRDQTNALNLRQLCNNFISRNEIRASTFASCWVGSTWVSLVCRR